MAEPDASTLNLSPTGPNVPAAAPSRRVGGAGNNTQAEGLMSPPELFDELWARKRRGERYSAIATLALPVTMRHFVGWVGGQHRTQVVECPAGTTVRIVMVSRFGDFGITERLDTRHGYGARVMPDSGILTNCRMDCE